VVVRTGTSVVIVAFVGLVSCSHGLLEREISGQVFVVRNDGQSVKLGLVEVQIFDAKDLANQLRSASLTNDQAEAEKLKKRVEQFEPELNRVVDRLSELAHAVPLESGDVSLPHLKSSGQGLIIVDFPRLKKDVSQYADYLRSAAYLFTKIAIKPLALAKTDADGKFTVRVPRGRNLAAVAAAQRYVGDSEELYFWAVNVPGNTIALSNDNEASSPRGESLVHCPSFHQRMMSDLKEKPELEARLADLIQQASNLLTQAEPGHVTIAACVNSSGKRHEHTASWHGVKLLSYPERLSARPLRQHDLLGTARPNGFLVPSLSHIINSGLTEPSLVVLSYAARASTR